jgi:hypothetical protein
MKQEKQSTDLRVFISTTDSTCDECGEELGRGAWITLQKEKGALCLACADLDHLVFLPPGDAAIARRARKYSTLAAVVLKWSRARKRYERQGLLVEAQATEKAEQECLADIEVKERRREREAAKRFDEEAVRLVVVAHIRHTETEYDTLLASGYDRWDARGKVTEQVNRVMSRWRAKKV